MRVHSRHLGGERGTYDGRVLGFDHHFNLLLCDVVERYTLPASALRQVAMVDDQGWPCGEAALERDLDARVVRRDGELVWLRRTHRQLFVMGDGVISVALPAGSAS